MMLLAAVVGLTDLVEELKPHADHAQWRDSMLAGRQEEGNSRTWAVVALNVDTKRSNRVGREEMQSSLCEKKRFQCITAL